MRVPGQQRKSYAWRWTAALAGLAVLAFALVMAVVVTPASKVQGAAATYTVDNTGDATGGLCHSNVAGDCSLRSAIEQANLNPGYANTIGFSVGISTISPLVAYDPIIDNGLTINGGGQTIGGGFATLVVNANNVTINHLILDGGGVAGNGVMVDANKGYTHLTNVEVRNYATSGILTLGNNDSLVLDTVHAHDNITFGISIGANSDDNIIRTSNVEDNRGSGIILFGGSDNQILNNNIDDNGVAALMTGIGATNESDLTISGNTISGNFDSQIRIVGGGTGVVTIKNNNIDGVGSDGIDLDISCSCGNVLISGSTNTEANCFSGNPGAGKYYLENQSGETVNAMFNYWAGDIDPTDKICATNQTLTCAPAAGSDVDWAPVAPSCSGVATTTPTPATSTPVPTMISGANRFYGYVYLNGSLAPAGTYVTATINGYTCGTTTVNADGSYTIDVASASQTTGCGYDGYTVNFTVAGYAANSSTWYTGATTNLNLTASSTATVTPIPTSTAIGGATVTPTTGPMVSVTLVGGACNPETSTYPDGTPIATLANAVSPSGILISIWWFNPSDGTWLGYSQQFPEQSDLTSVDRISVVFICVSSAGTWSRPQA